MFLLCHVGIILGLLSLVVVSISLKIPSLVTLFFITHFIYFSATIIPYMAVLVRRLHDTGRSAWFVLIGIIPLIGLIMIYFLCLESQEGSNEYGDYPI